ncbi:MAG: phosphohistidine phosphatase SixA [Acidobacteriota bacterium]|nr:phosphohistidine phosphatase SixA [Acidobacteriota bacterium]MDQ7087753.1 phosphohistidine phosphatase SixA [Acidobacteriota bacterium]
MQIVLMRHGIAIDHADPHCPDDFHRPLTEQGRERTRLAARGLAWMGVRPGAIVSSPLVRAQETATIVAEELGFDPGKVATTGALSPAGDPGQLLAEVRALGVESVLCTGHLPGMDLIVAAAIGSGRRPFTSMKKAGAVCIELFPRGWAQLHWLLPPRALRRLGGARRP